MSGWFSGMYSVPLGSTAVLDVPVPNSRTPLVLTSCSKPVDVHALGLHVLDQRGRVALVAVGPEEVAAHLIGGLLLERHRQRAHELVRLEVAARALADRLGPLLAPSP